MAKGWGGWSGGRQDYSPQNQYKNIPTINLYDNHLRNPRRNSVLFESNIL